MISAFVDLLFGCSHHRITRPFTPLGKPDNTYVVCLECGKEFAYNLAEMRVGRPISNKASDPAPSSAGLLTRAKIEVSEQYN